MVDAMSDEDDFEYHRNKRPDKTYVSKSITFRGQPERKVRIASKVLDSPEAHAFALEHGEHVIRVTKGGRQEVIAKFYEDNRGVFALTIQRFTTDSGAPQKVSFSFNGEETAKLLEFITNLRLVQFPNDDKLNVTDTDLKKLLMSPDQVRNLIIQNQDVVLQLAQSEITQSDIVALGYRRKQLEQFEKLLSDADYFEQQKRSATTGDEGVWQQFFEKNKWIFGYGLTFVYLSNLDDRQLGQAVAGFDFANKGKRADALMKTRGAIEALCFVEIKKHTTKLLKVTAYRTGCWAPSEELSGGVAQVQGTVERALRGLGEKVERSDEVGAPTGEILFAYQPKSYLVVGTLDEFKSDHGINMEKYRSFELFRRNTGRPEIITFDELYCRARFIVEHAES
jgi:hypothetical protein